MTNITHWRAGVGVRPVIIFHLFTLWQLTPLASCVSSCQLPFLASCLSLPVSSPPCQLSPVASSQCQLPLLPSCLSWPFAFLFCQLPLLASCLSSWPLFKSLPVASLLCQLPLLASCLSWGSYTLAHTRWTKPNQSWHNISFSVAILHFRFREPSLSYYCFNMVLFPVWSILAVLRLPNLACTLAPTELTGSKLGWSFKSVKSWNSAMKCNTL